MIGKQLRWIMLLLGAVLLAGTVALATRGDSDPPDEDQILWFDARAWLGVHLSDVTAEKVRELKLPGEYGAVIEKIEEDSPAAKAGLKEKDVILSFAEERVRSVAHLRRLIQETPPGRSVALGVHREGTMQALTVVPEARRARFMPEIEVAPRIRIAPHPMPRFDIPEVPNFEWFVHTRGPRLGVSVEELTPQLAEYFGVKQGKGVLVREVVEGSAAAKAGVKAGDVIVRVDDTEIGEVSELRRALHRERQGKQVTLTIVRDRREQTLPVTLDEPELPSPRRLARAEVSWDPEAWEGYEKALRELEDQLRGVEREMREKLEPALEGRAMRELEKQLRQAEKQVRKQLKSGKFQENLRQLEQNLKQLEREHEAI